MKKKACIIILFSIIALFCTPISSCKTTDQDKNRPSPSPEILNTGTEYKPTETEYKETFQNIDTIIQEIDSTVTRKDYYAWLKYLSDDYKNFNSTPENLKKVSESPTLKSQKITLKNLQDYFNHVIVPSQMKTKLESIKFVDEKHVKAYGKIYNELAILYYLEKNNGVWKIAIW